jgi:hypothetical protein
MGNAGDLYKDELSLIAAMNAFSMCAANQAAKALPARGF